MCRRAGVVLMTVADLLVLDHGSEGISPGAEGPGQGTRAVRPERGRALGPDGRIGPGRSRTDEQTGCRGTSRLGPDGPGDLSRTSVPGARWDWPTGVDAEGARRVAAAVMEQRPDGGWTDPRQAMALARAAGLPISGTGNGARPVTVGRTVLSLRVTTDQLGGPASTVGRRGSDGCPRCDGPVAGQDSERTSSSVVRDVLARMEWLVVVLPELIEAEVDPLVLNAEGPLVVALRVRLAPATLDDLPRHRAG